MYLLRKEGRKRAREQDFENIRPTISRSKTILDLDDACLIHLFNLLNPLPDLFNAARSCKRFRDLVHTRRSWLLVTPLTSDDITTPSRVSGVAQEYRQQFTSLHDAIAFSRPGDTILLQPGIHEASNLVISHPLQLIGDDSCLTPCTIRCRSNDDSCNSKSSLAAPVLNFAATAGRVSNVAIEGGIGGCIAHFKGRLAIEECNFNCDARGLQHLAAPLVSFACSRGNNNSSKDTKDSTLFADKVKVDVQEEGDREEEVRIAKKFNIDIKNEEDHFEKEEEKEAFAEMFNAKPLPPLPSTEEEETTHSNLLPLSLLHAKSTFYPEPRGRAAPAIGPGVVSVISCTMQGGSTAVQVKGTGAVESVRVIYEAHKALFWFDVDSNAGGQREEERKEEEAGGDGKLPSSSPSNLSNFIDTQIERKDAFAGVGPRALTSPSWVEHTPAAEFDPKALQAQISAAVAAQANR